MGLTGIKLIHTIVWISIEYCMAYVIWAGFMRRSHRHAAISAGVVAGESLIFAVNGFRCPLTQIAERLGAEHSAVTDIYLPRWLARRLPAIHVPLILLAAYLHARNLLDPTSRSRPSHFGRSSYHGRVVPRREDKKGVTRISQVLTFVAITAGAIAAMLPSPTADAAAKPSCTTVSVATLDRALTIDAAAFISTRPSGTPGSLICSYYGLSGHAKNEATIIYIPTIARTFRAVEKVLAQKYAVSAVHGIKRGAYEYKLGNDYYLFMFDGGYQVEIYAAVPLGRVERLARRLPTL